MLTCVVIRFFIIVLRSEHRDCGQEQIRGGRVRRQSLPERERLNYKYGIEKIDNNGKYDFGNFEKGETTTVPDYANDNTAVSMIPDIDDIVSRGTTATAADVDGGGSSGESYQSGEKTETIYIILAAATAGI